MKNIKGSIALSLLTVAAGALSSCGGGGEKTVQFWSSFGNTYQAALQSVVAHVSEKTGIDYPGESNSILNSQFGPVEICTMGYGHGISITPIQLITAVSAIGNDGVLLKPHFLKALTDQDGKVVQSIEPEIVRQVISHDTAEEMKDIMEYVVSEAGGKNARVKGYRIGGKTGTAYKAANGGYVDDFYSSFIGMAPIDDPKVTVLVIVDSPKGSYYGSAVAAPIAKDIFESYYKIKIKGYK